MQATTPPLRGCRDGQVAEGAHGPVTVRAQWLEAWQAACYYHLPRAPSLYVSYRGHREDLIASGCVTQERLSAPFHQFYDDGNGGQWYVASRAAPGKRGRISVSYLTGSRAVASSLPGVLHLFPEGLSAMTARPVLRLV